MGRLPACVPGLRRWPAPERPFRFHTPGKAGEARYLDALQIPDGPIRELTRRVLALPTSEKVLSRETFTRSEAIGLLYLG